MERILWQRRSSGFDAAQRSSITAQASRTPAASAGRSFARSGNRRVISASMSGATSMSLTTSPMMRPENLALTSIVSFQLVLLRSTLRNVRPDQSWNPSGIASGLPLVVSRVTRVCGRGSW